MPKTKSASPVSEPVIPLPPLTYEDGLRDGEVQGRVRAKGELTRPSSPVWRVEMVLISELQPTLSKLTAEGWLIHSILVASERWREVIASRYE